MLFCKWIKSNSNRVTNFSDNTMEFSKGAQRKSDFFRGIKEQRRMYETNYNVYFIHK